MGTLAQSMALMLEEFYKTLTAVGVSALTGDGMDGFFHAVDAAAREYESTYAKELKERKQKRQKEEAERQARNTQKFQADRAAEGGASMEASGASVVLDGTARGGDDEGLEARRRPDQRTWHGCEAGARSRARCRREGARSSSSSRPTWRACACRPCRAA